MCKRLASDNPISLSSPCVMLLLSDEFLCPYVKSVIAPVSNETAVMSRDSNTAHFIVVFWKSPKSRSTMLTSSKVDATSGLI